MISNLAYERISQNDHVDGEQWRTQDTCSNIAASVALEPTDKPCHTAFWLRRNGVFGFYIIILLYSLGLVVLGASISTIWNTGHNPIDTKDAAAPVYDSDSPLFDKIQPSTRRIQFNGKFWPGDKPTIFRQPPSPEVDAAWQRISDGRDIILSSDEVRALGKDPSKTVKAPPEWGYGEDAHLGLIHALHQVHCLDALRKSAYYNYYYRKLQGFSDEPPDDYRAKYYSHLDHCINFLLESIMCVADLSVSTYNWREGLQNIDPDFDTYHQCRDFDGVVAWHAAHQIDANLTAEEEQERWGRFGPGENDVILPFEPDTDVSFWDDALQG